MCSSIKCANITGKYYTTGAFECTTKKCTNLGDHEEYVAGWTTNSTGCKVKCINGYGLKDSVCASKATPTPHAPATAPADTHTTIGAIVGAVVGVLVVVIGVVVILVRWKRGRSFCRSSRLREEGYSAVAAAPAHEEEPLLEPTDAEEL